MDHARVAAFYRAKGYTVREAVLATGHSGNGHRVPLLCEGPLGNLAIFFGDEGGVDGPEMGGARRVCKDLGATPVLAAPSFTNAQRNIAAELGVVLLDNDAITPEPATPPTPTPRRAWPDAVAPTPMADAFAEHPWPDSGRPGGRDGTHAATFEVDDLLRDLDRPQRVPADAAAASAAPAPPAVAPAAPSTGSLWRNARRGEPVTPARTVARQPPTNSGFAWLGVAQQAQPTPIEVELEHSDVLQARARPVAEPAAAEPLLEAVASPEEMWRRQAQRRTWIRRAAWTGGAALAVYLFALWWF